jgi:enterobacterial common antigen flippase
MIPITIRGNGELAISRCTCTRIASSADAPTSVDVRHPAPAAARVDQGKSSYGQILKSSALVGGAQVANIAIGAVRTKAMAVLLGPAGFGLFGLYGSIASLTQSVAGMGINSSGVRQIAEAAGSGDQMRIGQTTAVLRRTSVVLGMVGAALLLVFSRPVSQLTFGSTNRAAAVSLLSIAVFFNLVSVGQGALIQGMRRIADLAKMNVFGALFGVCTGIPLVYFFRERGVVPSLVSVAAMTILTSWWYSRRIAVQTPTVTLSQVWQEASSLLKLGSAFMASGLMTMGVAYLVRIIIVRKVGLEATGLYQSAWTLGGLYVGFILQAMGADFYPRLTARSRDNSECNRLVNEQTLVGLLLAGPGVIGTLTLAPLVIGLLYSAKFGAAVEILRWICLGVALQVITWPMGFIIVVKGRSDVFFFAELAWTIVAVALAWVCVTSYGVVGAGIAFFGSYIFHAVLTYSIARHLTGFRSSPDNLRIGIAFFFVIGLVFGSLHILPTVWAAGVGTVATVASTIYSTKILINMMLLEQIPRTLRPIIERLATFPRHN